MPKGKIEQRGRKKITPKIKYKIGSRKSVRSAFQMNDEELEKILNGSGRGRDKQKVSVLLARRAKKSKILETVKKTVEGLKNAGLEVSEELEELVSNDVVATD